MEHDHRSLIRTVPAAAPLLARLPNLARPDVRLTVTELHSNPRLRIAPRCFDWDKGQIHVNGQIVPMTQAERCHLEVIDRDTGQPIHMVIVADEESGTIVRATPGPDGVHFVDSVTDNVAVTVEQRRFLVRCRA